MQEMAYIKLYKDFLIIAEALTATQLKRVVILSLLRCADGQEVEE